LETLDPIPDTMALLAQPDLVYFAGQVRINPCITFRDFGYQIVPDFAQAFHNIPSIMVKEHLMPVGLSAPGEDSIATQKSRTDNELDVVAVPDPDSVSTCRYELQSPIYIFFSDRAQLLCRHNVYGFPL
jgi:hypothetical protein